MSVCPILFQSPSLTCGILLAVALIGSIDDASAAPAADDEKFDLIIAGGKIVDGTGAPWYIADIGIRDGKIARIGRLVGDGIETDAKVIRVNGLTVAPGFVDMMGQSTEALLDDPKAALNMFKSVACAEKLGTPSPAGPDDIIRNMLTQPLDFDPGSRCAYSNFGYCLLGRGVEKLTASAYEAFVKNKVLDPAGPCTMEQGRSMPELRQDGEVLYYSPYRGPSVFAGSLGKRVPFHYGGNLEAMDSHGAWLSSVIDLARFAAAFNDRAHSKSPAISFSRFQITNQQICEQTNRNCKLH